MDQVPLVINQIDDGFHLARQLVAAGFEVTAVFWVHLTEKCEWLLYVALKAYDDEKGPLEASRAVVDAFPHLDDPWVSWLDIRVIGSNDPMTREVLELRKRHPGPLARYHRREKLGKLDVDMIFIYPPIEAPAPRPAPVVKIIGVKKQCSDGGASQSVEDEVGCVEGVIGEAEFNTRFSELIKSRFGSLQQFQATYPRIVLEQV